MSVLKTCKNLISKVDGTSNVYHFSGSKITSGNLSFDIHVVGDNVPGKLDKYVIWDIFNTGVLYIKPNPFQEISSANEILPYVYHNSLIAASNNQPDSNYATLLNDNISHNVTYSVNVPTVGPVTFTRYNQGNKNGWLVKKEVIFHLFSDAEASDQNQESVLDSKMTLDKTFSDADNLDDYIKKITKSMKSHFGENAKIIFKTENNDQMQLDFSEKLTKSEDENMNNLSYPVCSHLTINTSSVKIISKNYAYANVPPNFASCCHPSMVSNEKLISCAFAGGKDQQRCPYYSPLSQTLKTYNSQDSSIAYSVVKTLTNTGSYSVNIYNTANNSVAYTLLPPEGATDHQIIQEVDSVIQEVISSWPSEVTDNFQSHEVVPSASEAKEKKKSFILSLA